MNWYVVAAIAVGLWLAKSCAKVGVERTFESPSRSPYRQALNPGIQVTTLYSNGKSQTTEEVIS